MAKASDVEAQIEKQTTGSDLYFSSHTRECNSSGSLNGPRRRLLENVLAALFALLIIGGTLGITALLMWYSVNNQPSAHHGRIHVLTRNSPEGDYMVEWKREQLSHRVNVSIMHMDPQGLVHKVYTNEAGVLQLQPVEPTNVDDSEASNIR